MIFRVLDCQSERRKDPLLDRQLYRTSLPVVKKTAAFVQQFLLNLQILGNTDELSVPIARLYL